MPRTQPWGYRTPIWELYPADKARRIRDTYEERAAIYEFEAGMSRPMAEARAYAFLVDQLYDAGAIPARMIVPADVVCQIDRARRIRKHDVFVFWCPIVWALCQFGPGRKKGRHDSL